VAVATAAFADPPVLDAQHVRERGVHRCAGRSRRPTVGADGDDSIRTRGEELIGSGHHVVSREHRSPHLGEHQLRPIMAPADPQRHAGAD
jgi:hypothetical protein